MKLFLTKFIFTLLLFSIVSSCHNNIDEAITPMSEGDRQSELDPIAAREWFERKPIKIANLRVKYNKYKDVLWDFSKITSNKKGKQVLMIPIKYDSKSHDVYELNFDSKDGIESIDKNYRLTRSISYLLISKNKKDEFESEIVTSIPDQKYLKNNDYFIDSKNFTGIGFLFPTEWVYKLLNPSRWKKATIK